MQETRVLVETKGTTGEETISYWFDLPIDVAEFEEKLGVGAESGDYRIIEKVLPYADEVHEHTSVYQLNELDFMYRQLSSDMQEEYVSLLTVFENLEALYICRNVIRRMERRLAGAVTAGGVAGAVAGSTISNRKPTRNTATKDSRGNTTSSMGQRAGSKVGAVLDTKNKVKDKANAVKENIKDKSYWNSITNTGRFVVVLPDKYVQGLEVSENHLIIDTKEETDAELENKIKEDMQHQLVKVDKNGEINDESYRVNVRGAEIEQQKAMVAIVASLFMYIAFILISAVGTILAVQSLSDSTKYKYRYLTLRRLGINDKSLFKTIRKQLLILFCVPAISAILCSFVMMSSLNNVYQQILGDKHLYLMYFGLNIIIFFLIYSIYWIATYIGFKRNINEES